MSDYGLELKKKKRATHCPADEGRTQFTAHLPCNLITDERPSLTS